MTELAGLVRERIRREGPLPFREVMQAALYHPVHGYYTNLRGFGADGDFITSPEQHPAFGWLLGRQALDVWDALDRPRPFRILELGAGSGALAAPLVVCLRDTGVSDIRYAIDEASPSLTLLQQHRLVDPAFRWNAGDDAAHFIIANEVADALPVHRTVIRSGRCHELCVGLDADDTLAWVEAEQPSGALDAYFAASDYLPPDGSIADVCLDLAAWVTRLARRLERNGVALIMDYTASPPRDSLLTYYRHMMGSDPLIRLGRQDISAHVDVRALIRLAMMHGLLAGATTQRRLLLNLGLTQVQAQLGGSTDRRALAHLVDPRGPGGQIEAIFLTRDMPDYTPVGAVGRTNWPTPRNLPSLPPDPDESDFLSQWREAFGPSAPANQEAG